MIVVKIEMWPGGDEEEVREIGRTYIANVGGTAERGEYAVAVCRRGTVAVPKPVNPRGPTPTRSGEVKDYPRLSYNVWRLIARAILSAFPEEKGGVPLDVVTDADREDPPTKILRSMWAAAASLLATAESERHAGHAAGASDLDVPTWIYEVLRDAAKESP